MSLHAGFIKRLFAFIVDLSLVAVVTWLLWLFPTQMIVNKSIDPDYKHNVKLPNEAVIEKYSGSQSFFGSTTEGEFQKLKSLYDGGSLTIETLDSYRTNETKNYSSAKTIIDNLLSNLEKPYDASLSYENQFYSKLYDLYTYLESAYQVESRYPYDKDANYEHFQTQVEKGTIKSTEKDDLEKAFKEAKANEFNEQVKILVKALKVYGEKNEDAKIISTVAYRGIIQSLTGVKPSELPSEVTADDIASLSNYIDGHYAYEQKVTSSEYLGVVTKDGVEVVKFSEEAYYVFYYSLSNLQFTELLPYYVQTYNHSNWAIIYALSGFTLVFSVYTVILRGNTLGRRVVKIKLTDGHEKEKLNPALALLHDVPFRFLYVLALGLFSLPIAGIIMLVLTIADLIMIRFTKEHKCIRDYLTRTKVIQTSMF